MLGLILAIVLLYQVYKAANESGRNGVLWVVMAFVGSIIFQITLGFAIAIVLYAIGQAKLIDSLNLVISLVVGVANLLLLWLLIKYLSRAPESDSFMAPPPPPSNF